MCNITCLLVHSLLLHLMSFFHFLKVHFGHKLTLVVIRERKAPNLQQTDTSVIHTVFLILILSCQGGASLTCPSVEPKMMCLFSSWKTMLSSGEAEEWKNMLLARWQTIQYFQSFWKVFTHLQQLLQKTYYLYLSLTSLKISPEHLDTSSLILVIYTQHTQILKSKLIW